MDTPLTDLIRGHVARLFLEDDRAAATVLLERDCAADLTEHAVLLERIRCAVLKSSGGDLSALAAAITTAQRDWRDALVGAGFADDPTEHLRWRPK